jgi:hypothetical protein
MSFSGLGFDPEPNALHLVITSHYSLLICKFLHFSLVLMTLTVLKSPGQLFIEPCSLGLSAGFLMRRIRLWVWGKKTTEVQCPSYCMASGIHDSHMTMCSHRQFEWGSPLFHILIILLSDFFSFFEWYWGETGSLELFAWADFEPWSSWSLPPEQLRLEVWPSAWLSLTSWL